MNESVCRLCGGTSVKVFNHEVLGKYKADYALCQTCDLLQAVNPFWLEEAYLSPVSLLDTGIMARNIKAAQILSVIIKLFFDARGNFVDYAGGYGILVRLMRDYGFNFMWQDKYAQNIVAKGFEFQREGPVEMASLVECLEHFYDPITELKEMLRCGRNIFFTTELRPSRVPDPESWTYYAFETGQHIGFYSEKSLDYIAKALGTKLSTDGRSYHLLSDTAINKPLFRMLIKTSSPLSCFVRKMMGTKVMEDHFHLRKRS